MLIIYLTGAFFFASGAAFSFGLYQLMNANEVQTLTQIILPCAHLIAGGGILGRHELGRRLAFVLCFFYMVLGIFIFNRVISSFSYLPIAPLLVYLPQWLLKLNVPLLMAICFFALPGLFMLLISAEKAAVRFDPVLRAFFSWRAPLLVMLAAAFVIAYYLFFFSELSYMTTVHRFFLIGRVQSEVLNKVLSVMVLAFPFFAAFSFMSGARWAWIAVLFFAAYYWYPFFRQNTPVRRLQDFSFLFYGTGWALTALIALFQAQFFWKFETWWDRRLERAVKGAGRTHGSTHLFQKQGSAMEPAVFKPSRSKSRSLVFLVPAFFLLLLAGAGAFVYFGPFNLKTALEFFSTFHLKGAPASEQPLPSQPPLPAGGDSAPSRIRLEGTSLGPDGAYALMGGEIAQVGQVIQGYRVEAIEKKRILISKDGAKQWLDDEGNFTSAE